MSVSAITAAGTATLNGAVNLGNATTDDITITGRIASDIDPKTAASNTLGDATQTWQALYLDNTATDGGAIYFDSGSTEFIKANAAGTDLLIDGFTTLTVDANLVPQTTQISSIGSTSLTWSSLYLDTGATDGGAIYFNSGTSAFIKAREDVSALDIDGFTEVEIAGNLDLDGTLNVASTSTLTGNVTCSADVIIGSTDHGGILNITSANFDHVKLKRASGTTWTMATGGATDSDLIFSDDGATPVLQLEPDNEIGGTITGWGSGATQDIGFSVTSGFGYFEKFTSAKRYKENIVDLGATVDSTKIYDLKPREFTRKATKRHEAYQDVGFIAEEVNEVLPMFAVKEVDENGPVLDEQNNPVMASVRYKELVVPIIAEMKKLRDRIAKLEGN